MIDAEKELHRAYSIYMKDIIDLDVLILVFERVDYHYLFNKPFASFLTSETFEYVDGHGNETGKFGTRVVKKIVYDNQIFTISQLNEYIKEKK